MRGTATWFGILVIVLTWHSLAAAQSSLKILTLNFNAETDNKKLRAKRLSIIEDYIQKNSVDVVALQECPDGTGYYALAQKIGADINYDFTYHIEDGVSGIRATSLCVLAKKQYLLKEVLAVKLPHSALTIGDGRTSWLGFGEVNMLIGVKLTLADSQDVFFWTSHLNNSSSKNRLDQVKFAIDKMKTVARQYGQSWEQARVFFAGDFNSGPSSAEQSFLRSAGFQDLWLQSHPTDEGDTLAAHVGDADYNPMVHGASLFPAQYDHEDSERIDYIYAHSPDVTSSTIMRVFTAPVDNAWMSDHFGLLGHLGFGEFVEDWPASDSNTRRFLPTQVISLSEKSVKHLPRHSDYTVGVERGVTIDNAAHVDVQMQFTSGAGNVYTDSHAGISRDELVSFSFFAPGDYKYRLTVRDYRDDDGIPDYRLDPKVFQMRGVIHATQRPSP